jgi:hypothetical protein
MSIDMGVILPSLQLLPPLFLSGNFAVRETFEIHKPRYASNVA